jgi:cobalamin biosynthesis Mg chelatase CobN
VPPAPATAAATSTEALADAGTSAPAEQVEGVTFAPVDSTAGPSQPSDPSAPSALLYGAVAVLGLIAVLGGGWLFMTRPWTR